MNTLCRLLLLLIIQCVISTTVFSQDSATIKILTRIRTQVQSLNRETGFKVVRLDAEDFLDGDPDGGAELKGYFKKGKPLKIYQFIGVSTGNELIEFYYSGDDLVFVFEAFKSFRVNKTNDGLDHSKTTITFEGRYYFDKNKLIHKIVTGTSHNADAPGYPEQFLITSSNDARKAFDKKK